ncbi:uridylate kinase [[Candida] anglica]|uniref:Uridylate kinase n=1 Tax=[Candida] anglica TaxID=148631 RepID=A0ABP0EHK4_9ASCO
MFARVVRPGRLSSPVGARALAATRSMVPSMAQTRFYSSSGGSSSNGAKGKVLLAFGALAIGSTIWAATYNKNPPKSAVEPSSASKPTRSFKDGEVSVIFVLGGPGAGKGTQCANLVRDHGFVHLSAGDLLRAEQTREGSQYGAMIAQYIKDGLIVPQEVTIALLDQAIKEQFAKGSTKFLVDGFPRKMDQAITFEEQIAPSSFTLFFECPEQVMLTRLLERGKTSGRADDNVESIKKRFRTFVETSMPVVEYFEKQGKVVKVSCDKPVDEVYESVKKAMSVRGI